MADVMQITKAENDVPAQASPPTVGVSTPSVPIKENPGLLVYIGKYTSEVFRDFYNTFRFIGYSAQALYSPATRAISRWLGFKERKGMGKFRPDLRPDWPHRPRFIVNAIETVIFEAAATWAFFRDKRKFQGPLKEVVAAESGKDPDKVSMKDIFASENPIIQTAMNQMKALYALRFTQPLTFLWSLTTGLLVMGLEIVAERTAYIGKNSYEQLQKLAQEINTNQLGSWSRNAIVARFVELMQLNRADHNTPAIEVMDMEKYLPLLGQVADQMIGKIWHLPEMVYVLGQIIREPADPQKAQQAYEDVLNLGLEGIAAKKRAGTYAPTPLAVEGPSRVTSQEIAPRASSSQTIKDIIATRGQKSLLEPSATELVTGR